MEGGPRPPDEQGEFVDIYYEDESLRACGGQAASYDAFIRWFSDAYAGTDPGEFRAQVRTTRSPEVPCGEFPSCAVDGVAWISQELGQYHELVHLMQIDLDGRSLPSLEEGTAEAFGPLAPLAITANEAQEIAPTFLWNRQLTSTDYVRAAMFARFLVDRTGVERYRSLFRDAADLPDADEAEFRAQYSISIGEEFDVSMDAFQSLPRCAHDFWFCSAATPMELPLTEVGIDCDDLTTLGYKDDAMLPKGGAFRMERVIRFSVDQTASVAIALEHATAYLGKCGDCSQQVPVVLLASLDTPGFPPVPVDLELTEGTYVIVLREGSEGTASLSIGVSE